MKLVNVVKYGWMNAKNSGDPSVLNTEATIDAIDITIVGPWIGRFFLWFWKKMIGSSLYDCFVPFYKCMFIRIGLWLPFSDFEVAIVKHLKVAHSQLHPEAWAYLTGFQFCVEHKS